MKIIHLNMKNSIIIILICCLGGITGKAQNQFVNKGVSAYHEQDYSKAIRNFDLAIENRVKLNQENLSTAYYFRGKSLVALFKQTKPFEETAIRPEKYDNYIFEAFYDYEKAFKYADESGQLKIDEDFNVLYSLLIKSASIAIKNSEHKDFSEEEREDQLSFSIKCLNKAILIDDSDYASIGLLAHAQLKKKLYPEALENYQLAGQLYKVRLPEIPDFKIGDVYHKIGEINRYHLNGKDIIGTHGFEEEVDKLFQTLEDGKSLLNEEYIRFEKLKPSIDAEDIKALEVQFGHAMEALNTFELDIYLNDTNRKQEAIKKLKEAILINPDNYILHITYAQLIADENENEAVSLYEKAISIDSEKEFAHFNLGVIYMNRASEWSAKANEEMDLTKSRKQSEQAKKNLEMAKPFFEKTLKIKPVDLGAVEALIQVCIDLELYDDYKKYLELKQSIQDKN
jgi:hypothetical protein